MILDDLSDPMTWDVDAPRPRLYRPEAPPRPRDPGRAALVLVVVILALALGRAYRGWCRAAAERDEARAGVSIAAKGGGR